MYQVCCRHCGYSREQNKWIQWSLLNVVSKTYHPFIEVNGTEDSRGRRQRVRGGTEQGGQGGLPEKVAAEQRQAVRERALQKCGGTASKCGTAG